MTTWKQAFGDVFVLAATVALVLFAMLGVNVLAHAGPRQAPIPPQAPTPPQAPVVQPCDCAVTGVCTCGVDCPCVGCVTHRPVTATQPPPGEGWIYNASERHWWRYVETPSQSYPIPDQWLNEDTVRGRTSAITFVNPPLLSQHAAFVPAPVRVARPAFFNAQPARQQRVRTCRCVNGVCGFQ